MTIGDVDIILFKQLTHRLCSSLIRTVYFSFDPSYQDMYECQGISQKQILSTMWKYLSLFDDKSVLSFTRWCTHKKLVFLKVTPKRRLTNNGERLLSKRALFVLKKQFISKGH